MGLMGGVDVGMLLGCVVIAATVSTVLTVAVQTTSRSLLFDDTCVEGVGGEPGLVAGVAGGDWEYGWIKIQFAKSCQDNHQI